jgi:hypothetical protein
MKRARWAAIALLLAGLGGLIATWAFTTPPGGYPDEIDHYVRAVAFGHGSLRGDPDPILTAPGLDGHPVKRCCAPPNENVRLWVAEGARVVPIPASLAPETIDCNGEPPVLSVHCELGAERSNPRCMYCQVLRRDWSAMRSAASGSLGS